MSGWLDPNEAAFDEDVLVKREVGSYHVAMRLKNGRWVEWFCNRLDGVIGWKPIEK